MRGVQTSEQDKNAAKADKWSKTKKRRRGRALIFRMRQGDEEKVDRIETDR